MGCYNSVKINAPIGKVWTALRNFHDLSWAPNVIKNVEKVGNPAGTQVGAQRVLNGAFHETLLSLDDSNHCLTYSIDDGPDAVSPNNISEYVGEVHAYEVTEDNSTFVAWSSRWERGGAEVQDFCDPIYKALLGDLKKTLT